MLQLVSCLGRYIFRPCSVVPEAKFIIVAFFKKFIGQSILFTSTSEANVPLVKQRSIVYCSDVRNYTRSYSLLKIEHKTKHN